MNNDREAKWIIYVTDQDYTTLRDLLKELRQQPSYGQESPRYWVPQSTLREYSAHDNGGYKCLLNEIGEEVDAKEIAKDDPVLFGLFLKTLDEEMLLEDLYSGNIIKNNLAEWQEWLYEEQKYQYRYYNTIKVREENPSLFLSDVKGYIVSHAHELGKNPEAFAHTIHDMPKMKALIDILDRISKSFGYTTCPMPSEYTVSHKEDRMGIVNNNAIIATTWNEEEVDRIRLWVDELKEMKSLFLFGSAEVNGETTVVMVPDGSLAGWKESNDGDSLRDLFVKELEKANYCDGSNPWAFVEVGYGEYGQKVLRGNCKNCYDDTDYAG